MEIVDEATAAEDAALGCAWLRGKHGGGCGGEGVESCVRLRG
jgi:hypothetical protein